MLLCSFCFQSGAIIDLGLLFQTQFRSASPVDSAAPSLVRPWGLLWAMNGSLCCCSRRFWTIPSPAGLRGDTPCPTASIWAFFDEALLWYCHDCCFYGSPNDMYHSRPEHTYSMCKHTGTLIQTCEHFGACHTHTVYSRSCPHRTQDLTVFMLSRNLTRAHLTCVYSSYAPPLAIN